MTETEDKENIVQGEEEEVKGKGEEEGKEKEVNGDGDKDVEPEKKIVINPFKDETVGPDDNDDEDKQEDGEEDKEAGEEEKDDSGTKDLDTSDIITVEDNGEDNETKKVISDEEFFAAVSDEEKEYYKENAPDPDSVEDMNIHCTACGDQVNHHVRNNISRHPKLGVPICRKCKGFYEEEGAWEKDEQGSDCYCRWCANGGEMICCDSCTNAYCKRCITRNLGRKIFNQINDSDTWNCFLCDPKPIFSMRALMYSIHIWSIQRKSKLKQKEKEQKQKKQQQIQQAKSKALNTIPKPDNFIDENINEAFDTLKIYQKCLEDERKRWANKKRAMQPDSAASVVSKLKKVYSITKQNMELLEKALLQSFADQFPEEASGKYKSLVKVAEPVRVGGGKPGGSKGSAPSPSTNGQAANKRKMKDTSHLNPSSAKKMKGGGAAVTFDVDDDDDIAVEEIVMNGEPVMGNEEFFNPAALCTIQLTEDRKEPKKKQAPQPPKIRPFKAAAQKSSPPPKPTGPLRISSKMFKKKSPVKKSEGVARPGTPDSDIVEIVSDEDEENSSPAKGNGGGGGSGSKKPTEDDDVAADSDVSLE